MNDSMNKCDTLIQRSYLNEFATLISMYPTLNKCDTLISMYT